MSLLFVWRFFYFSLESFFPTEADSVWKFVFSAWPIEWNSFGLFKFLSPPLFSVAYFRAENVPYRTNCTLHLRRNVSQNRASPRERRGGRNEWEKKGESGCPNPWSELFIRHAWLEFCFFIFWRLKSEKWLRGGYTPSERVCLFLSLSFSSLDIRYWLNESNGFIQIGIAKKHSMNGGGKKSNYRSRVSWIHSLIILLRPEIADEKQL